ncbi:MAG TPA: hypothetical protein VF546_09470 [Pyrinomonadaceae bacterium]|jgi:hypothetical protein
MPRTSQPRSRLARALLILLVALGAWVAFDLTRAPQTDIRRFDPEEVARLDTAMWRSYYARQRARLFFQLGELLRTQYHFPFWQSQGVAYHAARAAFVFKDGKQRADYERALPDLVRFYESIRRTSNVPFDPQRAAQLELEWWIVHRQRAEHAPDDLPRALAAAAAEIYQTDPARLDEYARLRAEAMHIRDDRAAAGGVSEAEWQRIDQLLHDSWRALHEAVNR